MSQNCKPVAIQVQFLTGRYHATPWTEHVNNGSPEWPPTPYRLLRAIYDTWRRKRNDWPEEKVTPILQALSSTEPEYELPPYVLNQVQMYQKINDAQDLSYSKASLIVDAFVSVNPKSCATIVWRHTDPVLTPQQRRDLAELASLVNYLGRSESWVSLRLTDAFNPNCYPRAEGGAEHDSVATVACVVKASDNLSTWLKTLTSSTYDNKKRGNVGSPLIHYVEYVIQPEAQPEPAASNERTGIHLVTYTLSSKMKIPVTHTVSLSYMIHRYLMGCYRRVTGAERLSPTISGRAEDGSPLKGHRHLYILPYDSLGDGWIDHVALKSSTEFTYKELDAIYALRRLHYSGTQEPDVMLLPSIRSPEESSTLFRSITPFIPTRYFKKKYGEYQNWILQELKRELRNHGHPEPQAITYTPFYTTRGNRRYPWHAFKRTRKPGEPEKSGYGFIIAFKQPITAPIAAGYGAHFGLGQFTLYKTQA